MNRRSLRRLAFLGAIAVVVALGGLQAANASPRFDGGATMSRGDSRALDGASADYAGSARALQSVAITGATSDGDSAPPTTSCLILPEPNAAGWNEGPATVSLSATDSGSGVDHTYFTVGNSSQSNALCELCHPGWDDDNAMGPNCLSCHIAPWDGVHPTGWPVAAYTGPLQASVDGTIALEYYSVDVSGNVEATGTTSVLVDTVPPTTTDNHKTSYTSSAAIVLTAADTLSGVASTDWVLDGRRGSGVSIACGLGSHTLAYASTDVAGNAEGTHTVQFTVLKPVFSTTLKVSGASSTRVKKSYKLSGSTSPSSAGGKVVITLRRKAGTRWKSAGSKSLVLSGGRFSWTFKPKYRGSWRASVTYAGQVTATSVFKAAAGVTNSFKVK